MKEKVNFIDHQEIVRILKASEVSSNEKIEKILEKVTVGERLTLEETAVLLNISSQNLSERLFTIAEKIKKAVYNDEAAVISFQKTYYKAIYERINFNSLETDYLENLNTLHLAVERGTKNVGAGVLFGLGPWKFEILSLIMHNNELQKRFRIGFHTISLPRIKEGKRKKKKEFPYIIDDFTFKKIIAILRIVFPSVKIKISNEESFEIKKDIKKYEISEMDMSSYIEE